MAISAANQFTCWGTWLAADLIMIDAGAPNKVLMKTRSIDRSFRCGVWVSEGFAMTVLNGSPPTVSIIPDRLIWLPALGIRTRRTGVFTPPSTSRRFDPQHITRLHLEL